MLGQDHDRELPRGRVESVGHLAEHAFLVGAHHWRCRSAASPGNAAGSCRHQVGANVRRICRVRSAPRPTMRLLIPSRRAEGLAAPVLLGAASTQDGDCVAGPGPSEELGDEGRLADARLADDEKEVARPRNRLLERDFEGSDLGGTADEAPAVGSGAGCCGPSSRLKPSPHPFERAHADRRSASGDDRDWPPGLSSTAPSLDACRA